MDIAPDFFSFFTAGAKMLDADPDLMCVSAWNDNGIGKFVKDPSMDIKYPINMRYSRCVF